MGHFGNPKKYSAKSSMPAYKLKPQDLELVTSYLMAIPR
jgi:hypothetical protein